MKAKLRDVLTEEECTILKELDGAAPLDTPVDELTLKQLVQIGRDVFKSSHPFKTANAKMAISTIFHKCEIYDITIF